MICGFLALDKPAGLTSHGCVAKVRRAFQLKRVGHGGTLDPAVTGVLPLALGPATRLLPYLPGDKAYSAVVQVGLRTTTDDVQGTVLSRQALPVNLLQADMEAALNPFRGTIQQCPPAYSAVHVQGQRAYALAREGRAVALSPRPVTFHRLDLLGWDPERGLLTLVIACSAGTYIRALARDLGEALGCGAALASLRRTAALGFDLRQCITLDDLCNPLPPLISPLTVFSHLPRHQLTVEEWAAWRCGRPLNAPQPWPMEATVVMVDPDGKLAGMASMREAGVLQPRLVLDARG